jgi:hypothetical protein
MESLVLIKPGVLRALVIRAGHRGLGLLLRVVARNGYLGSMRTIHFAHWAMVNNSSRPAFRRCAIWRHCERARRLILESGSPRGRGRRARKGRAGRRWAYFAKSEASKKRTKQVRVKTPNSFSRPVSRERQALMLAPLLQCTMGSVS